MDYKAKFISLINDESLPIELRKKLEEIFNACNECEDVRIRKELITHCRNLRCVTEEGAEKIAKWIFWLEKQGEQKSKKVPIWKHWKDGIAGGEEGKQIYLIKSGLTYSISSCLGQECDYIELSELDKPIREEQGEQISFPKFTFDDVIALQCCMETVEDEELYQQLQSLHDRLHDSAYWMGKQDNKTQGTAFEATREEKIDNINKVEPKFKVGDWLVENEPNNYARFIQILEVVSIYGKEKYKISRDLRNDEDVVEYRFIENNYHPFTIQDAKEGDVLTDNLDWFDNPFIFILKRFENVYFGLPKPSDFSSHCFLTMSDKQEFREGDYHHMHNIQPANKEQRDLLFKKMHEANYEWDSKEKKLREMNSKWTSDDEQHLIVCENALYKYQASDRWNADIIIKWLEDKLKQGEQKPKWTEEDEKMFNHIVGLLGGLPNLHNWLRSVKQRMKEC